MKPEVINLKACNSSPAPVQLESHPLIAKAKEAISKGKYDEVSLQKLDGLPTNVMIVQWYGAVKGHWYPVSDQFIVK